VKGWSQVELGKRAGVRQATISHLESGNAKAVDLTVLEKIAKALGVAPGYLIVKQGK
jgi:transcriptional regulator with XRE-family HTH domain